MIKNKILHIYYLTLFRKLWNKSWFILQTLQWNFFYILLLKNIITHQLKSLKHKTSLSKSNLKHHNLFGFHFFQSSWKCIRELNSPWQNYYRRLSIIWCKTFLTNNWLRFAVIYCQRSLESKFIQETMHSHRSYSRIHNPNSLNYPANFWTVKIIFKIS